MRAGARWLAGIAVALWRYVTRRVPVSRSQETLPGRDRGPADRPVPGDATRLQPRASGVGPSLRRRYRVRIRGASIGPGELIERIARDPNAASPTEVSRFVKTKGRLGEMVAGDEYLVWMPGPWNGPVRVAGRSPASFRLATLRGHMEAGEIEFRARCEGPHLVVEIESAARSASRPFWLLYGPVRLAREIQLHMWAHFLERAARLAGGTPDGPIELTTLTFPDDRGTPPPRASRRARRALDRLHERVPTFDPDRDLAHAHPEAGWRIDDHCEPLPSEPPGPPVDGGSWEIARRLTRDYQFADPGLIRAVYHPDHPLERRDMVLEGRFLGLRFLLGVRIAGVIDESRDVEGRPARVWGWSYRTLEGHLEVGQMDFQVVKLCDTGEVQFRIHAVSRVAPIRNPVVRIGFRVFGRRLQLRFARAARSRMRSLVEAELGRAGARPVGGAESIPVRPARDERRADDALSG
jgi:uncharacterized protein (UPF0548 family)